MTIGELGAIGEFVGSIAVLVTLIYLATQIRQNTRSMEDNKKFAMAQAYQGRANLASGLCHQIDPEVFAKVAPEDASSYAFIDAGKIDGLSAVERARLRSWLFALVHSADNVLYQVEIGLVPNQYLQDSIASSTLAYMGPACERLGVPIPANVQRMLEQRHG